MKAVLAGLNTPDLSLPAAYGEFAGQFFFLDQKPIAGRGLLGSSIACPKAWLSPFRSYRTPAFIFTFLFTGQLYRLAVGGYCGYFGLYNSVSDIPGLVRNLISKKWFLKLRQAAIPIATLDRKSLLSFIFLSIIRYVVSVGSFILCWSFLVLTFPPQMRWAPSRQCICW